MHVTYSISKPDLQALDFQASIMKVNRQTEAIGPEHILLIERLLTRVCIVDHQEKILMDKFVKQKERVTNFRTAISGVTARDLDADTAEPFEDIRRQVLSLIQDKILVGHGILENDLEVFIPAIHSW